MRCHRCLRIASEGVCRHCGQAVALPATEGPTLDHESTLLSALADPAVEASESLWDDLCLALLTGLGTDTDDRYPTVALADMCPAKQCLFGLYTARRRRDEAQAAAHFAVALEQSAGPVRVGPATFDWKPFDQAIVDLSLKVGDVEAPLGRLDREHIHWIECRINELSVLAPSGWTEWTDHLRHRRAALTALLRALTSTAPSAGDSGFRTLWKDFQLTLGEERDRLPVPLELQELLRAIEHKDRATLRALEGPRRISALLDSSRNEVRVRAEALRQARMDEVDMQAQDAFARAFAEGGLDGVSAMREELRRETASAHAEQKKALDVQGRLLRGSQEALGTTLAELERRAAGLLWPLTPRTLFDEAREQAELMVERAREVAMIEQTDAWLRSASPSLETAADTLSAELMARKTLLEGWLRAHEVLVSALALGGQEMALDDAASLRARLREAAATTEGMQRVLSQVKVDARELATAPA